MTTLEDLNRDCPAHDRESCTDERPDNAGVDLRYGHAWCRRCEGISSIKKDAALAYCEGLGIKFNLDGTTDDSSLKKKEEKFLALQISAKTLFDAVDWYFNKSREHTVVGKAMDNMQKTLTSINFKT